MSTYQVTGLSDVKLLKSSGGGTPTLQRIDLSFANSVDFKPEEDALTFEGDGQKVVLSVISGVTVEVKADHYDVDALVALAGKTAVTTGLGTGVAKRWYFGDNTEASGFPGGLEATADCKDIDTGVSKQFRTIIPVGTWSAIAPPAGLGNKAKAQASLKLVAEKTAKDVIGVALPGVPTDGCFWYLEELT